MKKTKKLLSIILSICMLLSITAGFDFSAYAFNPRTTKPDSSNAYYYANNPFYKSGYGLPNCTCYAFGRVYEVNGTYPKLSTGNASTFYTYNQSHNYYSYGSTPIAGSVACWSGGSSGAGHVAFVESVNSNGTINISESNWSGRQSGKEYMAFRYLTNINPHTYSSSLNFQGYIYCCDSSTNPSQPSSGIVPIIYDDKNSVAVGETITFGYSGLGVCEKVNFFFEKDGKVYYSVDSTASKTMQTYFEQDGQYYIFCGGYINGNWYYSDKICVNVLNPKLTATKTNLDIKELLTFTYSGLTYASNVVINFEKNGIVYYSENVTSNRDFTTWFTNAGEYDVYVVGDSMGRSFKSNKIRINVTCKHNYSLKTLANATCTSTGKKEYTCTKCNYSYVETINKTSHKPILSNNGVKATCTSSGKESDTKCSVCGIKLTTGKTIAATGHSYTTKVVKPTYAAKGYTLHTCSVCKSSYKDTYTNKLVVAKPTISKVTSPKSKQIKVTWGKKSYTGYQIQIATDKNFTKNKKSATIKSAKTVTKTFTKLKGKTKYYVRVRAYKTYNGKNYYSAWSTVKSVTTKK